MKLELRGPDRTLMSVRLGPGPSGALLCAPLCAFALLADSLPLLGEESLLETLSTSLLSRRAYARSQNALVR